MKQYNEKIRWILFLILFAVLLVLLFLVVRPFIMPIIWASIVTISSWPIYERLRRWLPSRPGATSLIMTLLLLLVTLALVIPLLGILTNELETEIKRAEIWLNSEEPFQPPRFLKAVPYFGDRLAENLEYIKNEREQVVKDVAKYRSQILGSVATIAKSVLTFVVQFIICLFICFFFYRYGENFAAQLKIAVARIGGEKFEQILLEAKATIKGAVLGVLATSLVQGVLAGIGFALGNGPTPVLLGFICMVFSLIPFGTPLIYLPVTLYMMASGQLGAGIFVLAWCVFIVSMSDNVLRPYFISQATATPLIIVFIGVLGGAISFGLVGIFIGPVIVAISQVLWRAWTNPQEL